MRVLFTLTSTSTLPSQVGATAATNVLRDPVVESAEPAGDLASAETGLVAVRSLAHPTAYAQVNEVDVDPTRFFERPMTVAAVSWDASTAVTNTLDIFADYFNITAVQRKLYGYSRARFVINIRLEFHPTAFHFGDLLVWWSWAAGGVVPTRVNSAEQAFQYPHVMLSAANPSVTEMQFPFHWPEPYLDITSSGLLTSVIRPRLMYGPIAPLGFSNGAVVPPVVVTVRMWLTDVELTGPTGAAPFSQSAPGKMPSDKKRGGKVGRGTNPSSLAPPAVGGADPPAREEGATGPVSTVAAIISQGAATVAREVPFIAPWARVFETGASLVGSVASLFGFSTPPDTRAPLPIVGRATSSFALVDVPSSAQSLNMFSTSSLTVSGSVLGAPDQDEMTLSTWFSHESYLGQFTWALADAVDDTICAFPISPRFCPGTDELAYHTTAVQYASMPFAYWRGSLIYKVHISASRQHRGRLRIVYEPTGAALGTEPYGVRSNCVLDLDSERDLEVCVSWASQQIWLNTGVSTTDDFDAVYNPVIWDPLLLSHNTAFDNGRLFFIVEAPLIAPQPTNNDILVTLTIRGGPDFQVCAPDLTNLNYWAPAANQSGGAIMPVDRSVPSGKVEPNVVGNATRICCINGEPQAFDKVPLTTFGEIPMSLRSLVKRFGFYMVVESATTSSPSAAPQNTYRYLVPIYPGYAFVAGSVIGATTTARPSYNWLNWYMPGYGAMRGSVRWRAMVPPASNIGVTVGASPDLFYPATTPYIMTASRAGISLNQPTIAMGRSGNTPHIPTLDAQGNGMAMSNSTTGILDVDVPPNTRSIYVLARNSNNPTMTGGQPQAWLLQLYTGYANYLSTRIHLYAAAGEDFSFSHFLGSPILVPRASIP